MSMDHSIIQGMFQNVGFGESTNIGFPGESSGLMPIRRNWRDIERANFAFGYGFNVTNLQLAQAYLVLANDGEMKPLSLLRTDEPVAGHRVMDASVARAVSDMLRSVTEKGGTGTKARVEGYSVAGKTGTVHKQARGKRGYAEDRYFALFAGMVPAENPRIVAVVTIDEPGGERYGGGSVAAPVFSTVMKDALRLLNIPPETEEVAAGFAANRALGRAG
jgi:cell division protein FtsI (penicillin-binding protein 3)